MEETLQELQTHATTNTPGVKARLYKMKKVKDLSHRANCNFTNYHLQGLIIYSVNLQQGEPVALHTLQSQTFTNTRLDNENQRGTGPDHTL